MTPDLTPILSRFSDEPWSADAQLDDLIRCPISRLFCLHQALEESFDIHISDAEFRRMQTVGDVQRTVKELL